MGWTEAISACIQAQDAYSSLAGAPGSFATSHLLPSLPQLPLIDVADVGPLSFPVPPSQSRQLIERAQQAPFGMGERTVVDLSVRRCWQIDAAHITLDSAFQHALRSFIVPQVCADLGLTGHAAAAQVRAHLYKLLIYEQGGFFAPHKDSEKEPGMFGTLVLLLPSRYSGGQLQVEHAGATRVFDCAALDAWRSFSYAAFYADCRHEIKPVLSGYRVALTFNLCQSASAHADKASSSTNPALDDTLVEDEEEEEEGGEHKQSSDDGDEGGEDEGHPDEGDEEKEGEEKREEKAGAAAQGANDGEEEDEEEAMESADSVDNEASPAAVPEPEPRGGAALPSAARLSRPPPIVRRLASAFLEWSASADATRQLLIPLSHEYTQHSLAAQQLKNQDQALLSLIRRAVAVAGEEKRARGGRLPPVLPHLCLFEVHRTGVGSECYWRETVGEDFEWSSCTATHVQPVPLTPPPPTLSLYYHLLSTGTSSVRVEERQMLHTDADFDWSDEEADSEEDSGPTGNEGVSVDRFYRRAAILLVRTDRRWAFLTSACGSSFIVSALQHVGSEATEVDLKQRVKLVTAMRASLVPSQLPSYLLTLTKLRSVVNSQPSSPTRVDLSERLLTLMLDTVTRSSFDFCESSTPAQLDQLASAGGIDWLAPLLVGAFTRSLSEAALASSQLSHRGDPLTPEKAAQFLLRFFFLHHSAASSSSTSSSSSASAAVAAAPPPPPVYDGTGRTVRAICEFVLSHPSPAFAYTFSPTLEKEERHQVHLVADEVGRGRLVHESTGQGSRRALTISRVSGRAQASADPLPTIIPASALTRAQLPQAWLAPFADLCAALWPRVTEERLTRGSRGVDGFCNAALQLLWLLSVVHVHRLSADAPSSGVSDGYVEAAQRLSGAVARRVEAEWGAARAVDRRRPDGIERADAQLTVYLERRLLQRAMDCFSWLLMQTGEQPSHRSNAFHSALRPLAERFRAWLQELLTSPLPPAGSWQYPAQTCPAVGQWPSSAHRSSSSGLSWCGCADCGAMRRFLHSSTEHTISFCAAERFRSHVEERVDALGNPHLRCDTVRRGSPHTLQVTKTQQLLPLMQLHQQRLQQALTRVEVVLAALQCVEGGASSAPARLQGRGMKRARQPSEVIEVDDEEEAAEGAAEKEKEGSAENAGGQKGGHGGAAVAAMGESATASAIENRVVERASGEG